MRLAPTCKGNSCFGRSDEDIADIMSYAKKPIPPDSVLRILADAQTAKNSRASEMPTEQDAIDAMHRAYTRLKELGWNDGMYMPKDGTTVTVMQIGSTGTFDCAYVGEWADGFFNLFDGGDVYPSRSAPPLFRPKMSAHQ